MKDDEARLIVDHFSQVDRVAEYLGQPNTMNEVRRDLVRRVVLANVPRKSRVLEIGCGIGSLTAELSDAGMLCTGIDSSPEMIKHAHNLIGNRATIVLGDLFDESLNDRFSAVIANGVAPYYRDTKRFLDRIASLVQPNGISVVVHRNSLFNFFAFNRGTVEFVRDDLLADMPQALRQHVATELGKVAGLTEPVQKSSSSNVYRASENPLTISESYNEAGLDVREIRYCFIHGAPPRLLQFDGAPAALELQQRYEKRWEGMFLGSQFVVVAASR
jgi:SAM-dependent methyltransferase